MSTFFILTLRTLPTSLIAALAFNVPNVIMCATLSTPYFSRTYSITCSLCSWSKSISISGIEILSGFRNLSNIKLYFSGSISVIFSAYETILPAAEPLPGPTYIPFSFAYLIKSQTIIK